MSQLSFRRRREIFSSHVAENARFLAPLEMTTMGLFVHCNTVSSRERVISVDDINYVFAIGESTLMPRNFGITFSAKSLMLFSVYSRGALPTEKFAIIKPKPTLLA